jgi:four helix bundle protein
MKNFRNLKVWERAHQVVLQVYAATRSFPREEIYGLTSQIRRAAYSIPSNIAEGCGRGSDADFGRFVSIALGSASELEYHLLLSRDLGMLPADAHAELVERVAEVGRMLNGLLQSIKTS